MILFKKILTMNRLLLPTGKGIDASCMLLSDLPQLKKVVDEALLLSTASSRDIHTFAEMTLDVQGMTEILILNGVWDKVRNRDFVNDLNGVRIKNEKSMLFVFEYELIPSINWSLPLVGERIFLTLQD